MADIDATSKIPLLSNNRLDAGPLATPSPLGVGLANSLSYLRLGVGLACVAAPTFTCKIFQLTIAPNSVQSTLARLFGGRDIVLAELLWFVRPKGGDKNTMSPNTVEERRELRRILWANVASDTMDIAVLAFAASKGAISKPAAACLGGGAVSFLALGLLALREL
jgi:hypothetical protein